jgi:AraC family transcriptional regulator of adaptative response/methylated-DNA-[protein]-cysteine methyltransferase
MQELLETGSKQAAIDYQRIEKALLFIEQNYINQPSLKEIADAVHLSEYHFDRLFSRWAGTSPQRFLRFLTKEYAKQLLLQSKDLLEVTYSSGLSSPGRLHDLFVTYEAMSPGEYKQKGAGISIWYGFHPTPFGECLIAVTQRGICALSFVEPNTQQHALVHLHEEWTHAVITHDETVTEPFVEQIFTPTASHKPLTLLLRGTNFQIKVWEALLKIPVGHLASYADIASAIGNPKASRAVGSAIGSNQLAYLIPCHRVIQKMGIYGQYRWGATRKRAMLAREAVQQAVAGESGR